MKYCSHSICCRLLKNNTLLFDLLFEQNQTMFQIDATLLISDSIYLFEVKNYYGDFFLDGDVLRTLNGNEVKVLFCKQNGLNL